MTTTDIAQAAASPYPNSTDRTVVAVYHVATGVIRKVVRCSLQDAHRQHTEHPDHDYVEVNHQVHPYTHAIDVNTKQAVPRTLVHAGDMSLKELDLRTAHADAIRPNFDLTAVMLKAALGDEDAKATARSHIEARVAADKKLAGNLETLNQAKTVEDVNRITWGDT